MGSYTYEIGCELSLIHRSHIFDIYANGESCLSSAFCSHIEDIYNLWKLFVLPNSSSTFLLYQIVDGMIKMSISISSVVDLFTKFDANNVTYLCRGKQVCNPMLRILVFPSDLV